MGRPRKWVIRTLSRREIEDRERFIEGLYKLLNASPIRERLRQDWDLFLLRNCLTPSARALELFVADAAVALKETSAAEYCDKMSSLPALKLPGMRQAHWRLRKALHIRAADVDLRHALDIDTKTAKKIIAHIDDEPIKYAITLMGLVGPRCKDLTHIRRRQLDIKKNTAAKSKKAHQAFHRVQVRVAKNRKQLSRRVNLYVPTEWRLPLEAEGRKVSLWLDTISDDEKPFAHISTQKANAALARACDRAGVRRVTTYSFRRIFITDIIRICKRDFTKIRQYTLHFAEDTIRSFYDKW